ncbi:MAG: cardiolipin synthase ClsB [Rhodocyclales bacterium]|nr:cardiolipin synthase ClsB [Rhodocyclales bacterium]
MKLTLLPGNRVELLETGGEYFPALLAAIEAATQEIHLETYIFADDATGRSVADALLRAAARGVAVHLMVDGFGARDFPLGLGKELVAGGVRLLVYRPDVAPHHFRRTLRRLHRKLAVIDARIAFVGGINVIDDMDTPRQKPPRYDYAVVVEGPLLEEIHAAAKHLWHLVQWVNLQHRHVEPEHPLQPVKEPRGDTLAALVIRDNLAHRRDIEDAYLEAIANAREEVVIACAYFLPGWRFRRSLEEAAQRGVRIVVLLQGRVEYLLLHYAAQALHGALLKSGVRIFEYHRSFLHAKVAVVDDYWATVGSSNIDPFSLLLAREANVVVHDRNFATRLRRSLQQAMDGGAVEVKIADLNHRPLLTRCVSWLAYGMVRVLTGLSLYGTRRYQE